MQFKRFIKYFALSILVLLVILQALFLFLPTIVENIIVKTVIPKYLSQDLAKDLPNNQAKDQARDLSLGLVLSDLGFKIEKIGLTHVFVSRIHLGQDMSADLVDIQYQFKNFKRFQIESVTISGLKIHARVDADKQIYFNGTVFPGMVKGTQKHGEDLKDSNIDSFLYFLPKQVELKKASLSITTPDHELVLPFDVQVSLDSSKNRAVLKANLHPLGQTIKAFISGDFYGGIESVRIEARSFHPEVLSGLLPGTANIRVSGPVDIDIVKNLEKDWLLSLSKLSLDFPGLLGPSGPSGAMIKDFTARLGTKEGKVSASGKFDLAGPPIPAMGVLFDFKLKKKLNASPFFDLTIKNKKAKSISLDSPFQGIGFQNPNLLVSLKGDLASHTGQFLFECKNFTATKFDEKTNKKINEKLFVKNILFKSNIKGNFSDKGKGLSFDIHSHLSAIKLLSKIGESESESANLTGQAFVTKQFYPSLQVDARIKNAKINAPKLKLTAVGINAGIPFSFPFKKENKKGSFSIQEIGYNDQFKAGLRGNITQSEPFGVSLAGQVSIADLDGFNLRFNGGAGADASDPHARIEFMTDPFLLMPAHIAKIMPGVSLSADSDLQFSSKGTIEYKYHDLKTQASIMIDKGNLFFPDMNLNLKGIAGGIAFNDLIVPESLPGQVLTIDKIKANQFEFDQAKARFSIEDGKTINIENLHFNWCNGIVSTESIRLPGIDNTHSLILYCDRLELAGLLKQMGAFHAEGEGTLSGRIPVVYSQGNISFDKGFLFSTPGKGGRVVIENTQNFIAGIPMDTPQFVQLDLAREALKDFDYKWAKLELNTLEDTLFMNMELDGKPAKLLPFVYKKNLGSFVRVDATSPGSRFQGIKLDVNLKLPFNQVLKFGNKLKNIFN